MIKDLWATNTECRPGGLWSADLWVRPEGGDGTYTYYIEGDWRAGPITTGTTIRLNSQSCAALVGTVTVESGDQIKSQEYFIHVPSCCGQ